MLACLKNHVNIVGTCEVTLGVFQPGFDVLEDARFLKKV